MGTGAHGIPFYRVAVDVVKVGSGYVLLRDATIKGIFAYRQLRYDSTHHITFDYFESKFTFFKAQLVE